MSRGLLVAADVMLEKLATERAYFTDEARPVPGGWFGPDPDVPGKLVHWPGGRRETNYGDIFTGDPGAPLPKFNPDWGHYPRRALRYKDLQLLEQLTGTADGSTTRMHAGFGYENNPRGPFAADLPIPVRHMQLYPQPQATPSRLESFVDWVANNKGKAGLGLALAGGLGLGAGYLGYRALQKYRHSEEHEKEAQMSSGLLVAADRLVEKLAAGPQFPSLSQIPAPWLQKGVKPPAYTPPPTVEQTKAVAGQLGTPAHSAVVNQTLRNRIAIDPDMATMRGKPETMQPIQLQPPKPNQHPYYGKGFFQWDSPGPVIRGATDFEKKRWQEHLFDNSEMGMYLNSPGPFYRKLMTEQGKLPTG